MKTLKDFNEEFEEIDGIDEAVCLEFGGWTKDNIYSGTLLKEKLKATATEWVKELEKELPEKPLFGMYVISDEFKLIKIRAKIDFIKHFFNLEEDLK